MGSTKEQHNERLIKVLQHTGLLDIWTETKMSKLFSRKEISQAVCSRRVPDKSKVIAILEMPLSKDKKGVLRVRGMINFIGKFTPNLSSTRVHLGT